MITPITASVNCAVSAGEKSSPTKTILPFSGIDSAISIPAILAWTLLDRSWKSATRSSNVGSPPRSSANSSTAFPMAAAAPHPSLMCAVATSISSSSSMSIFRASKISAEVPPAFWPSSSRWLLTNSIADFSSAISASFDLVERVHSGSGLDCFITSTSPTAETKPTPRPLRIAPGCEGKLFALEKFLNLRNQAIGQSLVSGWNLNG